MGAEGEDIKPGETPEGEDLNPQGGGGNPGDDEPFDKERAMQTIRTLRQKEREFEQFKKDAGKTAERLQKLEDSQKTEAQRQADELERLRKRNQELEESNRRQSLEQVVNRAVASAKVAPGCDDIVAEQVMRQSLELDADGKPTDASLKAAIKAVKATRPILFEADTPPPPSTPNPTPPKAPTPPSGNPTNAARPPAQAGEIRLSQLRGPGGHEFYVKNRAAIMAAQAAGTIIDDTQEA